MAAQRVPFQTAVLQANIGGGGLPASYRKFDRATGHVVVDVPATAVQDFLERELSLGKLDAMVKHLWFAGAQHPATPLLSQLAVGRDIVPCERMDLHLLWQSSGKIFIKPVPRFLLDADFWTAHLTCPAGCACQSVPATADRHSAEKRAPVQEQAACVGKLRKVALGFLYSYACLVAYESDFQVANEKRLLPRNAKDATIPWAEWKTLVAEILASYDRAAIHPRFWRAELRLTRLNTIHRFTRLPPFNPYLRTWRTYGSLFHDNLAWLAVTTVFIALVLTAMQLGLATTQLQDDPNFMAASYGFTIFAILGPICAFGLVILASLLNLVKDLPWLLGGKLGRKKKADPAAVGGHVEAGVAADRS